MNERHACPSPETLPVTSAVERAIAFGIDITLLTENQRCSPTERLRRGERILVSVIAFKEEVQRARQQQKDKS